MGAVLALVTVVFTPTRASAASGTTTRVNVASNGAQANAAAQSSEWVPSPSISADGRYVAFESRASNLVDSDTNGFQDIFVHDNQTGVTTLVSLNNDGFQANGTSEAPSISADGRYVAFASTASNLVSADTNLTADIFVHDRHTGATTLVSVVTGSSGAVQANNRSERPSISADGRYVAFESRASNLTLGEEHPLAAGWDVFVHDRSTSTTTRVSKASDGTLANGESRVPSISSDGRYVAFMSTASNLVAGDTKDEWDVFVRDLTSATTTLVSKASDGTLGDNTSRCFGSCISGDGRYVAFSSAASNLVVGDTNSAVDAFVHDRQSGATTRVSVAGDGTQGDSGSGYYAISANARYLAFQSVSSNLSPDDTNHPQSDTFLKDLTTGSVELVNTASDGTQANGSSDFVPSVSDDGRVAYVSHATNLVSGDTNGIEDVFVHDPKAPAVFMGDVSVHEGDGGARAAVFTVSLSQPAPATVTVAYATAKGSAIGTDFTARSGTVTFPVGVTGATVKVPVTGDTADEPDESFNLVLSSPVGATIGDGTGVGTILDDDSAAGRRLAIGDVSVHEGDAGRRVAVFNVSLSKASINYVSVKFATVKGTAVGTDFTAKSGILSFVPGTTSKNVEVAITPDATAEGNESFGVTLSNSNGPTISDATGVGTILDND